MSDRLKTLQEAAKGLLAQAEAIREKYRKADDPMPEDESTRMDTLLDEFDGKMTEIEQEQKFLEIKKRADEKADEMQHPTEAPTEASGTGRAEGDTAETRSGDARGAEHQGFSSWLKSGPVALADTSADGIRALKALQVDQDTAGGYLVPPMQFVRDLIQDMDDDTPLRGLATVITLDMGASLGVPTLDTDMSDPTWTSEVGTVDEDNALEFGRRELMPKPLRKLIKISNRMLRAPGLDAEEIVRERMMYRFSVAQENGFLNGSGANQPLGLFTASDDGIPTGRDVATGNTATAITAEGLIEALYSLKQSYWRNARWLFHRNVLKSVRKLKTDDGEFLWQGGLRNNLVPTLLDVPYVISNFAPNTFTANSYVGMVGDFSYYWIADSLTMQMQRLVELYATTDQVGFIGRLESDGQPVQAEAFARIKLGA